MSKTTAKITVEIEVKRIEIDFKSGIPIVIVSGEATGPNVQYQKIGITFGGGYGGENPDWNAIKETLEKQLSIVLTGAQDGHS